MVSVTKDLKTYSSGYKKAASTCIINQVPVEKANAVIEEVVENITFFKVDANTSTVAYEIGVLTLIQVCEAILSKENANLTLGWHASSCHVSRKCQ